MRSINSLSVLNPLEEQILGSVPSTAKHVAVIGDGDGRLARAIRGKLGADAAVFVVEPRIQLHKYFDDFTSVGQDPWKVEAYVAHVKQHGRFDFMVFYGVHGYWGGQIRCLQQLIDLCRPNAPVWVTFVNSSALRFVDQELPPLRLAADALTVPSRLWSRIDYAAWMACSSMLNSRTELVWGLLDATAFQYCQNPDQSGTAEWNLKGTKIEARTVAEIIHWGAAYIGLRLRACPDTAADQPQQALTGALSSPQLFQALLDPFPETATEEGDLAWAETELRVLRKDPESLRPGALINFLLGLVEEPNSVRDVLVMGAGWGRDVYMIKKARPQWHCAGVESSEALVALGADICRQHDVHVERFTVGEKLPFADKSFDVIFSLGAMSKFYDRAAGAVASELLRIGRKAIYHLEDARGPEQLLKLKQNSLPALYAQTGHAVDPKPVLIGEQNSGFQFYKVTI